MKALVVYYSQSGNTEKAAKAIAKRLQADIMELQAKDRYRSVFASRDREKADGILAKASLFLSTLSTCARTGLKMKADLLPLSKDPGKYDLIVIGTPNWMDMLPPPILAFLPVAEGKEVALLCTSGSGNAEKVFKRMEDALGHEPRATLGLSMKEMGEGSFDSKIDAFISSL